MKRKGATLIELVVVLVVGALLGGVAAAGLADSQRSTRAAAEIRAARAELRDAAAVLSTELRGSARVDTLRFAADTALEFFAPLLTALTCTRSAGGRLYLTSVPPRRSRLTGITPDSGDLVWVWREDTLHPGGGWMRARISSYSEPAVSECDSDLKAAGDRGRIVTLSEDPGPIDAGMPVQIVRRGRYSIYRSSDGAWHLGYRRCDAIGPSSCQTVQPVAGPYRVRSGAVAGIHFRYFDSSGTELHGLNAATAWRVELIVRSDTSRGSRRAPRRTALDDSLAMAVAFRNSF